MEAGTSFGRWYSPGEAPLPQDNACADMYRAASRVLGAAGYEHYEVRAEEEIGGWNTKEKEILVGQTRNMEN